MKHYATVAAAANPNVQWIFKGSMPFTKEQKKVWSKQYYLKHKEKFRAYTKQYWARLPPNERARRHAARVAAGKVKNYRSGRAAKVDVIKSKSGCVRCGEPDPIVLDCHHRDPNQKLFGISEGMYKHKWEVVVAEIKKCDILCANCHRRVHAEIRSVS